jgi:hypothetical protein
LRLRFRATELGIGLLCLCVGVAAGCERTTGGSATRATATTTASASLPPDPAEPVPGVEVTLPDHIPPNAVACMPPPPTTGSMARAAVADPVAPVIVTPLPDGWNSTSGSGDVALTSTGPEGMSVKVTITPTDLDPGGAFLRYATDLRTAKPDVRLTVAPAQFCGYSSQLLNGTMGSGTTFADRITHIWTNTRAYLVVIHLEGPAGAPGFDAAKSTVTQQFAVVIP